MLKHGRFAARSLGWPAVFLGLAVLCLPSGRSGAAGVQPTDAIRVEEDWELVIETPDLESAGPQVTCVFSPQGDMNGLYGIFEINHRLLPDFAQGGLQLQVWNDGDILLAPDTTHTARLATAGEKVTWTQAMSLEDGQVKFEIVGGASETWGPFGGEEALRAAFPTQLENLNGYSPEVSVENSGVGFGANHVGSLVLKRVRYYTAQGLVYESNDSRTVYPK